MDRKVLRLLLTAAAVAAVNIVFAACSRSDVMITGSTTEDMASGSYGADEYTGGQNKEEDGAAADVSNAGTASFSEPADQKTKAENAEGAQTIYVHVCGAVISEGVYELQDGARVFEAVAAAGGFSGEADREYINQAQVLTDGIQLRIPTKEETHNLQEADVPEAAGSVSAISREAGGTDGLPSAGSAAGGSGVEDTEGRAGRININTASAEELTKLVGIGPSRASQIIEYRREHGEFESAEDIMNVSGIGEKIYNKFRDQICTH